jgi:hypothetical protein
MFAGLDFKGRDEFLPLGEFFKKGGQSGIQILITEVRNMK